MQKVFTHIHFPGTCEEALKFYGEVLGAETRFILHFNEAPISDGGSSVSPELLPKVMHAVFTIGETTIFASKALR